MERNFNAKKVKMTAEEANEKAEDVAKRAMWESGHAVEDAEEG